MFGECGSGVPLVHNMRFVPNLACLWIRLKNNECVIVKCKRNIPDRVQITVRLWLLSGRGNQP